MQSRSAERSTSTLATRSRTGLRSSRRRRRRARRTTGSPSTSAASVRRPGAAGRDADQVAV